MENRRFAVKSAWGISPLGKSYDECLICPVLDKELEEYDGWNFVGKAGSEGASINIYPNLEQAILKAGYNPFYITFEDLNEDEINFKDNFLKKVEWTYEGGIKFICK